MSDTTRLLDDTTTDFEVEGDWDMLDNESRTSTERYNEEPHHIFNDKVMQLCKSTFAGLEIETEHMEGGSFNRVIGIAVKPAVRKRNTFCRIFWKLRSRLERLFEHGISPLPSAEYVVRIRRDRDAEYTIRHDVATLDFVRTRTLLPIPAVIKFDDSENNVLESAYMIQNRIFGVRLDLVWPELTQAQRYDGLRKITLMTAQLHNIMSDRAGVINPSPNYFKEPEIGKLHLLNPDRISKLPPASTPQTTFEFMMEAWERVEKFQRDFATDEFVMSVFYKIRKIIRALRDKGFFPDDDCFHFAHTDLFPRNILVQVTTYRAPFYFWPNISHPYYNDDSERCALLEPETDEGKELKSLFENLASKEWLRYAFTPEYVIARRIVWWLWTGCWGKPEFAEGNEIVRAWQQLHYNEELVDGYWPTVIDEGMGVNASPESEDGDGGVVVAQNQDGAEGSQRM
ncbi:hypothetical protein DM02DRAFT_653690 [Periconia macrospinosa]|uniref:Aminoglycoside phosphotransferase domain-containing protein n=1 Tax=Periconia macrospinosa TaxID=97972 RepID=A0A2V1DWB7_9PLEO|nr:hypothetical protein DM02DRAFT_653690 [Periconia macrospinosa]